MSGEEQTSSYMSDETFNELKESLEHILQHVRGERNDLRMTVLPAPSQMRALYAEFAEDDRDLAEAGMADYAAALEREDAQAMR